MTTIKAASGAAQNVQQMTNAEVLAHVAELKSKLELQKQKLANVDNLSQFSMEMQAEHAGTLAMIEAEETLLANYESFVKTGVYPDGTQQDFGAIKDAMSGRESGWNDTTGAIKTQTVQSDQQKIGASYAGTIMLENSGAYDPANPDLSNMLAFVADDSVVSVKLKTVGKDIHAAIKRQDGSTEIYVLDNMAVRPEDVVFYFGDAKGPIEFDASQVVRVSDGNWGAPFGETFGLIIYGSSKNDRIVGSQGADVIMGSAGDDKVYGVGGDDRLYGDDFNDIGASGFGVDDGNDLIDGGAGINIMKAGGGNQDKIIGSGGSEHENPGSTQLYDQPDPATFLSPAGDAHYKDGTLVLDADSLNGTLQITMPPGYAMATAEPSPDAQAAIFTLAGFDANGDPHTIRLKVRGFFDPKQPLDVTFQGNDLSNIIDCSALTLSANVTMHIAGGKGDDTILSATTKLDQLGIDADTLGHHTYSEPDTLKIIKARRTAEMINGKSVEVMTWGIGATTADGFEWKTADNTNDALFVNAQGEIELTNADANTQPGTLNFSYPPDFQDAMLLNEANGDKKLVFINHTVDGTEQVVLQLKGINDKTVIMVGGTPVETIGKLSTIDGDGGYDTVYASSASATVTAEETIQGVYPFDYEMAVGDNKSKTELEAELADKLTDVKKTLSDKLKEKEALEKEKKAETDTEAKKQLEADLKKLGDEIAALEKTESELDNDLKDLKKEIAGE